MNLNYQLLKCSEHDPRLYMDVSKNRDTPKMDGENNGKPY